MKETHSRSILKGISWRITASLTTVVLVYLYTGDLLLTAQIGMLEVTLKLLFYYTHERLWGQVHWGVLGPEPKIK